MLKTTWGWTLKPFLLHLRPHYVIHNLFSCASSSEGTQWNTSSLWNSSRPFFMQGGFISLWSITRRFSQRFPRPVKLQTRPWPPLAVFCLFNPSIYSSTMPLSDLPFDCLQNSLGFASSGSFIPSSLYSSSCVGCTFDCCGVFASWLRSEFWPASWWSSLALALFDRKKKNCQRRHAYISTVLTWSSVSFVASWRSRPLSCTTPVRHVVLSRSAMINDCCYSKTSRLFHVKVEKCCQFSSCFYHQWAFQLSQRVNVTC